MRPYTQLLIFSSLSCLPFSIVSPKTLYLQNTQSLHFAYSYIWRTAILIIDLQFLLLLNFVI